MNPYMILAVVIAFVGNGFYWYANGVNGENTRWKAKVEQQRADAEKEARTKEQMWQGVVNGTVKNYEIQVAGVRRNLDAALDSLRSRPWRSSSDVPGTPGPACPCGTGASLCREDGEFLAREAARADEIRAGLVACYEVMDSVR